MYIGASSYAELDEIVRRRRWRRRPRE